PAQGAGARGPAGHRRRAEPDRPLPGEPRPDAGAAGRAEILRAADPALAGARGSLPAGGSLHPDARARRGSAVPGTVPAAGARGAGAQVISPRDIPECFEGIIPAMMTTCSLEGEPNITEISQVHLVDDTHVALSHQFFNKTQRNVRENPHASVLLFSPRTYEQYRLQLRFDHPESEGPLFDEMAARLQVIASHTGMVGVFKLRCADVYEVLSAEHVEGSLLPADPRVPRQERTEGRLEAMARELRGLQAISCRVNRAGCLEVLLESVLQALEEELGFRHAMVLLPDERGRLVTTASHGYGS